MKFTSILAAGLLGSVASASVTISLWADDSYQGKEAKFTTSGSHSVGFSAKSYIMTSGFDDGCCVVFCRGSTNVGKYCDSHSNSDSSAGTTKVVIGCGGAVLNC